MFEGVVQVVAVSFTKEHYDIAVAKLATPFPPDRIQILELSDNESEKNLQMGEWVYTKINNF